MMKLRGFQSIYRDISPSYELVDHIVTFGLDKYWRRKGVAISLPLIPGQWLDVCTGTGELAEALKHKATGATRIYATDFSPHMMKKAIRKKTLSDVFFLYANTFDLPFKNNSFELITISFATRNLYSGIKDLTKCFKEFYRVLKPGGKFIHIETSRPENKIVRFFFDIIVRIFVPAMCFFIPRAKRGYKYLALSIPKFYNSRKLKEIIISSGFNDVKYKTFTFGAVAVHTGVK